MNSSIIKLPDSALTFGSEIENEITRLGVEWLEGKNSPRTQESYDTVVRQFITFLEFAFDIEYTPEIWKKAQGLHVISFKKYLAKTGYKKRKKDTKLTPYSKKTINQRLSCLSSFFDDLVKKQVITHNPANIDRYKVDSSKVEAVVLSEKEARSMIDAPREFNDFHGPQQRPISDAQILRDSVIVHVFFFRGCRISELCNLKVKDYFTDKGFPVLKVHLKGDRTSTLAINQQLQTALNQYLEFIGHGEDPENPLILPLRDNQEVKDNELRHLNRHSVRRIWDKYAHFRGIKNTTPHSARATFATTAIENGCPLEVVQEALGHSWIDTTRSYVKNKERYHESASFKVHY